MTSNPSTFSQIGVEATTDSYFMADSAAGGGMMSANVPHFHPTMLLDHGGSGFGFVEAAVGATATAAGMGAQFAANNVMLASFASQLFATAPAPPQDDHLDVDSCGGAASLPCPGQSGGVSVWSSPSSKTPYGSRNVAGLPEAAGGFQYQLAVCGGANAPAASELPPTPCSTLSSDSARNAATDQCSSVASRSVLTELPPRVFDPQAHSRPAAAHFAVVVASSPYAAVAQEVLNSVVCRQLSGVADVAADSDRGSAWPSSGSVGAPSAVSSNQREHLLVGGDAGPRWRDTQRARSHLKMLQLMDEKYNQCLDEIQSTTAKFNTLMHPGGAGAGNASICAPFAHRAVSAVYRGLRRRIAGEIMAAATAGRPTCWGESSSSSVTAGDVERCWEAAFIQRHWAAQQQQRRGEQPCWRPPRGLPEKSVAVLKAWMFENFLKPYPSDHDKDVLAARSGLTRNRVSNWFINARVRLWKPLIEEMYKDLKSSSGGRQGGAMEQHMSSQDIAR